MITLPNETSPDLERELPVEFLALLGQLPPWQIRYAFALRDLGGLAYLACRRGNVSRRSVTKAMKESASFVAACAEAVRLSATLPSSLALRGGDREAILHAGQTVGYEMVDRGFAERVRELPPEEEPEAARLPALSMEEVAHVAVATVALLQEAREALRGRRPR